LPEFNADWTTVPGRIVMSWIGLPGVTLPDNDTLVKITFSSLVVGETPLTWFDDGTSCEYSKYDGGEFNVLNDIPTSTYYINGLITTPPSAPVTIAPIHNATPNTLIYIPFKVVGFTDIGSISLTMDYNPAVLTYLNYNSSTIPLSWTWSIDEGYPGRMILGGFGPAFSLTDTSILFNVYFLYHGGTTLLEWYDADGTSCEYADENTVPLNDLPQPAFYIDGLVTETIHADFSADDLTPPKNATVYFTDLTSGGMATSWNWSFSPNTVTFVNSTSASSQNPEVQFINGGLYAVTLTASNVYTADSETKTAYIRAGIHGLWIGITSTDWLTSSNWDDDLNPDNLSDVLITASTSPTYWPKYTGSLVVGNNPAAQCKSIIFEGSGYMLTVKGTLTTLSNMPGTTIHAISGTGNIKFEIP